MKIVVIGGTGLIGSKTVGITLAKLRGARRVAQRRHQHHYRRGLKEALTNAEVVIELANSPSFED